MRKRAQAVSPMVSGFILWSEKPPNKAKQGMTECMNVLYLYTKFTSVKKKKKKEKKGNYCFTEKPCER